jgi:hypothetical protein
VALSSIFVGDEPVPERWNPISMKDAGPLGKPSGGLWTCPEVPGLPSLWMDWCLGTDNPGFLKDGALWRVTAENPLVYEIDSWLGFQLAVADRPYRWMPDQWSDPTIDFEQLAEVYDAVYLTARGLAEIRYAALSISTWDVPTILWLRWCHFTVERVG